MPAIHCKFPHWLIHADHIKKKILWRSLTISDDDQLLTYDIHRHDWIVRTENYENVSTTLCISETNSNDDEYKEFVVYTTNFWCRNRFRSIFKFVSFFCDFSDSYFSCVRFFRRNDQIVQFLEGRRSATQFAACSSENFHESKFDTLLRKIEHDFVSFLLK